MTIDDTLIVSAGAAAWAAVSGAVVTLWKRCTLLESRVADLQEQVSSGDAAKEMINSCPTPACPYREDELNNRWRRTA